MLKRYVGAILSGVAICAVGLSLSGNGKVSAAGLTDNLRINPEYTQYMNDVRNGRGSEWKMIPNKYLPVDTAGTQGNVGLGGSSLPSSYNLTTSGYATTIKNQGGEGICWAYATTTVMESYMKKTKGVSIEFSPKQLDYVTTSGTRYGKYLNDVYGYSRELGDAGNFFTSMIGTRSNYVSDRESVFFSRMKANDPSLEKYETFKSYNDLSYTMFLGLIDGGYKKAMSESQVYGDKAEYIINGLHSVYGGNYVDEVKKAVYNNGAVFVATYAPETENCWDASSTTIVDRGADICGKTRGHALAIVGWDDNHSYKDPATGSTVKGAFIVQNSYGKSSLFSDYNITADELVDAIIEGGGLAGKTEEQIAAFRAAYNEAVDNYNALEYLYLGYNSDSLVFGIIDDMVANKYVDVYDSTRATSSVANGAIKYKMTSSSDNQAITEIGVELNVPVNMDTDFTLGIDGNGDGTIDGQKTITVGKNLVADRQVVKLDSPVAISGDFTVTISSDIQLVSGNEDYISTLVYTEEADENSVIPVPDTSGDSIAVPNTGMFNGDGKSLVIVIPVALGAICITAALAYTLKSRVSSARRIRFTKK